jgi:hypothetical protein
MRCSRSLFSLAALLALSLSPPASAQDTTRAKLYVDSAKIRADSIAKRSTSPTIDAQTVRIKRFVDSIYATLRPRSAPVPVVASIAVHGSGATLGVGATMGLSTEVRDQFGAMIAAPISWSASPTSVATVSSSGALLGVSAGSVTVSARSGTVVGSRVFTVTGTAPTPQPPDTSAKPPIVVPPVAGGVALLPINAEIPDAIPATATSTRVAAGADLQAALEAAPCNSTLLLDAGASWVGNYVLPASKGAGCWVVVRTGLIVRPTTRTTPTNAATLRLARVWSPSYEPAFATRVGTSGIVLADLDIGVQSSVPIMNMVVRLQDDATRIILTGNYIHGHTTLDARRAVLVDVRDVAITKNWISEWHSNNGDDQALIGYDFTARIRIEDNYLEASHEIIMWGGADPRDSTRSPSDIIIRRNHISRPLAWKGKWQVKNLIETKNVRRMLVEGNVIENVWADAQAGFAIVLKSENQNGTAPWTTTSDVTFQDNLIRCVASGFNLSGRGSNPTPNIPADRFTIRRNVLQSINANGCTGDGIGLQLLSKAGNVHFDSTTFLNAGPSNGIGSFDGEASPGFVFVRSFGYLGDYGFKGSGAASGTNTLTTFAPGFVLTGNAFIGDCSTMPPGNACVPSVPVSPGADAPMVIALASRAIVPDGSLSRPRAVGRGVTGWKPTPPADREYSPAWLAARKRPGAHTPSVGGVR